MAPSDFASVVAAARPMTRFDHGQAVCCHPKHDNAVLLADHGCCWARCRDRVGVPMDKLPNVVLQAKDAGHTQSQRSRLIASANLGMTSLHFHDAGKTIGHIFRNEFHARDIAIAIVRGSGGNCFSDLSAATCIRSTRVAQSYVVVI
jgi:hypothetical protein